MKIRKRIFNTVSLSLISVFTHFVFSLPAIAGEKSDTVSFLQITDTHICNLLPYHHDFVERRQHYGDGVEPLKNFLHTTTDSIKSDFVVITGDMIDFYEAESVKGEMLATQIEQFIQHINSSNIPVYLTIGNHDISSYPVKREGFNQYNAGKARATWIRNASCFRNGTYYSRTMQVGNSSYRLIFLDNGYYSSDRDRGGHSPNIIDKYQLLWLDDQLKKSDDDIEIIFMHLPLFNYDSDQEIAKAEIPIDYSVDDSDLESYELYKILSQNSSTPIIFDGHKHSNLIHRVNFPNGYSVIQITTGAFSRDPENWRWIQLTDESIIVSSPGDVKEEFSISTKKSSE